MRLFQRFDCFEFAALQHLVFWASHLPDNRTGVAPGPDEGVLTRGEWSDYIWVPWVLGRHEQAPRGSLERNLDGIEIGGLMAHVFLLSLY
jgi:hypothetical protein